jgi:hypothetical protein
LALNSREWHEGGMMQSQTDYMTFDDKGQELLGKRIEGQAKKVVLR